MRLIFCFLCIQMTLMSATTTVFFVRHGQTDWNVIGRLQGQSDIPLNEKGRTQAAQLAEKLSSISFDACYASDLQRAAETAEILNRMRTIPIELDPRLRERNFGPWEGLPASEFEAKVDRDQPLPTIEADDAILKRVLPLLGKIADKHPHSTILVVTHGGVMRSLIASLLPFKCSSLFDIQVENMGVLKLAVSKTQCTILEMEGIRVP
jgi:broad specificity phosphatase PhoE